MKIGIDLGGTNVRAGLVDPKYHVTSRRSVPTECARGFRHVVDRIAGLCRAVAGKKWSKVTGLGIGAPGPLDLKRTKIVVAPNLGWRNVPLARMLQQKLRKPVRLENDANCAAMGEYLAGAGRGTRSLVLYTLGTGVGGGIVVDGKLVIGASGGAGELGHMVVQPGGRLCGCGQRGCVEAYGSATAITGRYKRLTGRSRSVKDIFASRDAVARRLVNEGIDALALGMINIVHAIHPEVIVIGGGISAERDERLLFPLRKRVAAGIFAGFVSKLRIVKARLGDDAGIVGAAAMAVRTPPVI